MGTNFIVAYAHIGVTRERAIEKLRSMDRSELLEALENVNLYEFEDIETSEDVYDIAVRYVTDKLDEVYSYSDHGSRDTAVIRIDGKRYLVTGGMSWGYAPTDAFDAIALVSDLGLTSETEG